MKASLCPHLVSEKVEGMLTYFELG